MPKHASSPIKDAILLFSPLVIELTNKVIYLFLLKYHCSKSISLKSIIWFHMFNVRLFHSYDHL